MICRRELLASSIGFATFSVCAKAQTTGAPEYNGVFAGFNAKTGIYTALERVKPVQRVETRLLGFAGGESYFEVPGARSPVRLASASLEFVAKVASQDDDPLGLMELYIFQPVGNTRRISGMTASALGLSSQRTLEASKIDFNAAKMGTNFFRLTPTNPLMPGEYVVGMKKDDYGFAFGVDA